MNLLLYTRFYPSVGGLETVMELLAREWVASGHTVRLATDVAAPSAGRAQSYPFEVIYQPPGKALLDLVRWSDAYIQGCIGLRALWPLLRHRRTYAVTHQTWYRRHDGRRGWQDRLKCQMSRHAINFAPSRAVAADLPAPCTIIPNPYRADLFHPRPEIPRERDLLFVGRLVSDKGVHLLLRALLALRGKGLYPSITVIGNGPELEPLQQFAAAHGCEGQVRFDGMRGPAEVARAMNSHRILVVPSLWAEPFGVVAVEGIACGCAVLGSEQGGLADAIGPCGLTFRNGDAASLADGLEKLLTEASSGWRNPDLRAKHLALHEPSTVALRYLETLQACSTI